MVPTQFWLSWGRWWFLPRLGTSPRKCTFANVRGRGLRRMWHGLHSARTVLYQEWSISRIRGTTVRGPVAPGMVSRGRYGHALSGAMQFWNVHRQALSLRFVGSRETPTRGSIAGARVIDPIVFIVVIIIKNPRGMNTPRTAAGIERFDRRVVLYVV